MHDRLVDKQDEELCILCGDPVCHDNNDEHLCKECLVGLDLEGKKYVLLR